MNQIKVLLAKGGSVSEVARELGVDRKTVRKYRDMEMGEIADSRRRSSRRERKLNGFAEWIEQRVRAMADDGVINAQSIYLGLKELGYRGSARSVRRFVSGLRKSHRRKRIYEPFETPAGQQAMVDLGEKRRVRIGGGTATVHFVSMVLCFSRRKYVEWFDRPVDTESFIRFHQRAFENLGGAPQEIVYDQTKLAVLAETYGEVDFNESFYGFAQWCGFRPWICNKFDPETKGKIESVVRYVKRGFLPGRSFDDLADLRGQSRRWLDEVADAKVHETTRRIPLEAWREERGLLRPPGQASFRPKPSFRVGQAHLDGLVKVLGNRYSVPSSHHGQAVKVRVTARNVEFRTMEGEHLHTHRRAFGRGKRIKVAEHYRKEHSVSTAELTRRLMEVFQSPEFAEQLRRKFPRHYREQCRRLVALRGSFEPEILRRACRRVIEHHCVGYRNLKETAIYLKSIESDRSAPPAVNVQAELPEDLGMQPRLFGYYDQEVGEAGQ